MPPMILRRIFIAGLLALLTACGKPAGQPAPVGDHAALEQLADAYRATADQFPVSLQGMNPKGKRQFVEQVFSRAGYDYPATLDALAAHIDATNPDHRDLAELLLLPRTGLADDALGEIFSTTEQQALRTIQAALR